MKKLLLLLLIMFVSFAGISQINEAGVGRFRTYETLPEAKPAKFRSRADVIIITSERKAYFWDSWRGWQPYDYWDLLTGGGGIGQDGKDATIRIGSVTSVTSTTSNVVVTDSDPSDSDAEFNFVFGLEKGKDGQDGLDGLSIKGEKGDKGDKGDCSNCPSGGGGSVGFGYMVHNPYLIEQVTFIEVRGQRTDQTVAQSGYNYPSSIGINSTDHVDLANLRYAAWLSNDRRKGVVSSGTFYTNKMFDMGETSYFLDWNGYYNTTIQTRNNNTFIVMGRKPPTDNTDANQYIQAKYKINGLIIIGQSNQTGFEPQPSYHSEFSNISCRYMKRGFVFRFNLNGKGILLNTWGCDEAFYIGFGNWVGATASNSQSNHFELDHPHAAGGWNNGKSAFAFFIHGSSGTKIDMAIAEQHGFRKSYFNDFAMSPNVKDGYIYIGHLEGVNGNSGGSSESYYEVIGVGVYTISGVYSQYQGITISATAPVGQVQIIAEKIVWDIAVNGKSMYNGGGANFLFRDCGWQTPYKWDLATVLNQFDGVPVSPCYSDNSAHCGGNTVTIDNLKQSTAMRERLPDTKRKALRPVDSSYKFILTMNMNSVAFDELHVGLKGINAGTHSFPCYTRDQAQKFADANPDWNYTITEI